MNKIVRYWCISSVIIGLIVNCSTIRRVRPLTPGTSAVTISCGGPIIEVGKQYMPLPLLSLGYNYGITSSLGLEAGIGVTSAVFSTFHFDGGINWFPFSAQGVRPGLVITPKIFLLSNFSAGGTRAYPTLTPTLYWELKRHLIYLGAENWFELHHTRSDGNTQEHHWLATPYIGYGISIRKWMIQLEGRAYVPTIESKYGPTNNFGFGEYGIVGVFLGVNREFGRKKR